MISPLCWPSPRYRALMKRSEPSTPCTRLELRCHPLIDQLSATSPTSCVRNGGVRFKNRMAPSRHSGLNSLSPKEPSSSLTSISTFSGTSSVLISPNNSCTSSSHSTSFRSCKLAAIHQNSCADPPHEKDVRDKGVGVLLDSIDKGFLVRTFYGAPASCYQRPSTGPSDAESA